MQTICHAHGRLRERRNCHTCMNLWIYISNGPRAARLGWCFDSLALVVNSANESELRALPAEDRRQALYAPAGRGIMGRQRRRPRRATPLPESTPMRTPASTLLLLL